MPARRVIEVPGGISRPRIVLVGDRRVEELGDEVVAAAVRSEDEDAVGGGEPRLGERRVLACCGQRDARLFGLRLIPQHERPTATPSGEQDPLVALTLLGIAHARTEIDQDVLHLESPVARGVTGRTRDDVVAGPRQPGEHRQVARSPDRVHRDDGRRRRLRPAEQLRLEHHVVVDRAVDILARNGFAMHDEVRRAGVGGGASP